MTDELQQIKEKLDLIINYFHIGQKPPRTMRDIKHEIDTKIIHLTTKRKRAKKTLDGDKALP